MDEYRSSFPRFPGDMNSPMYESLGDPWYTPDNEFAPSTISPVGQALFTVVYSSVLLFIFFMS